MKDRRSSWRALDEVKNNINTLQIGRLTVIILVKCQLDQLKY